VPQSFADGLTRAQSKDPTVLAQPAPDALHFMSNMNSLGEGCDVCHASGALFAVGPEHAK
jgi:hypothetical protein